MNDDIKLGRQYPRWFWWFLDKYCQIRKKKNWQAIRGEGWSRLYYEKEVSEEK